MYNVKKLQNKQTNKQYMTKQQTETNNDQQKQNMNKHKKQTETIKQYMQTLQ